MGVKRVFDSVRGFVAAGGHITAGIIIGTGHAVGRALDYVESRLSGRPPEEISGLMQNIEQGVNAGELMNQLGPDERMPQPATPIFPDQYGDTPNGRRVTTAADVTDEETGVTRTVRIETEDFLTLRQMEQLIDDIISRWKEASPKAFAGMGEDQLRALAIHYTYSSARF